MDQFGTLTVKRKTSSKKSAIEALVAINDEVVGGVRNGEEFRIRLPVGEHRVKVTLGETYSSVIVVDINISEPTNLIFSPEQDICRFVDDRNATINNNIESQTRITTFLVYLRIAYTVILGFVLYKLFAISSQLSNIILLLQKRL